MRAVVLTAVWIAACLLRWQTACADLPWIRTAIALALFVAPGAGIFRWARTERRSWASLWPIGLTLSMSIVGVIGAIASGLSASFEFAFRAFVAVGAVCVFSGLVSVPAPDSSSSEHGSGTDVGSSAAVRSTGGGWARAMSILGVVGVLCGARLGFDPGLSSGDELTHLARTQQFHQADSLGNAEHLIAAGETLPPRFWLAFWPLAKALIAELADVEPLLLHALWLEPLLVAFSLLAVFALARRVGLSESAAWLAVIAQLACLSTMTRLRDVGFAILARSTEDKVAAAILFAPVFFGCVIGALARGGVRRWSLVALAGGALTFTHGPVLGMAVLVACAYGLLDALQERRWRPGLRLLAVAVVLVLPQAALRFVSHPMNVWIEESIEATEAGIVDSRLSVLPGGGLYGIGSEIWFHGPFLIVLTAAGMYLVRRRDRATRFVLGYTLCLVLAVVPYTGWLLGCLLTPMQLWRLTWMAPFGLASAALVTVVLRAPAPRRERWYAALGSGLVLMAVAFGWAGPRVMLSGIRPALDWPATARACSIPPEAGVLPSYADLVAIGNALDEHAAGPVVVVGDSVTNDLLPTVSREARLVVFRNPLQSAIHAGVSKEEAADWTKHWRRAVRGVGADNSRRGFLKRHEVEFLVLARDHDWLVATESDLEVVQEVGELALIRVVRP